MKNIGIILLSIFCVLFVGCTQDGTPAGVSGDGETVIYETVEHVYNSRRITPEDAASVYYTLNSTSPFSFDCNGELRLHASGDIHIYDENGVLIAVLPNFEKRLREALGEVNISICAVLPSSDGTVYASYYPRDDLEHTEYRILRTDFDCTTVTECAPLPFSPTLSRDDADNIIGHVATDLLLQLDGIGLIYADAAKPEQFYLIDDTLSVRGPFETTSLVYDGYMQSDGTMIFCCEDGGTIHFDPLSETLTPVKLHMETDRFSSARNVYYREDSVYLICSDGIWVQRGGEEIKLLDWTASCLNYNDDSTSSERNVEILDILPGDRFLIGYRDMLSEMLPNRAYLPYPMLLTPLEGGQRPARQVISVASAFASQNEVTVLREAIFRFNRENTKYRIAHRDLDAMYPSYWAQDSGNIEIKKAAVQEDLLAGLPYDLYFFGSHGYVADYLETITKNGIGTDLTAFADEIGIQPSIRAPFDTEGELQVLPLSIGLSGYLTTTDTLPAGTPFTPEVLRSIADTLGDGQALFSEAVPSVFLEMGVQDYFDISAGTHTFDEPAFAGFLTLFDELKKDEERAYINTDCGYVILSDNGVASMAENPIAALVSGDLKFLKMDFATAEQLLFLPALFEGSDKEYHFCGYPTESGGKLRMTPGLQVVMPEDAEVTDGAYAFLRMLFSDTVQACSLMRQTGIPVTQSGLQAAIPAGYHYFMQVTSPQSDGSVHLQCNYQMFAKQPLTDDFYADMTEIALLDQTHERLYETAAGGNLRGECNEDIFGIIWEEYSAVREGVRTLSEAIDLIVRRAELRLAE